MVNILENLKECWRTGPLPGLYLGRSRQQPVWSHPSSWIWICDLSGFTVYVGRQAPWTAWTLRPALRNLCVATERDLSRRLSVVLSGATTSTSDAIVSFVIYNKHTTAENLKFHLTRNREAMFVYPPHALQPKIPSINVVAQACAGCYQVNFIFIHVGPM
jgi:hypothetical protein